MNVHVMPLGDVVAHEGTPECVCGPGDEVVQINSAAAQVGMIFHHYALQPCTEWEVFPGA
ncbi:hypothetical protein [Rhizohabitans arisaemae]|uniref:hypothetical protein n=1 Tax=Rhizohabitans arisaemae TaxID=2720610 RepID=UPI0024B0F6E1|nr:hypothetical protein [Rhizohabitans arisaemae]